MVGQGHIAGIVDISIALLTDSVESWTGCCPFTNLGATIQLLVKSADVMKANETMSKQPSPVAKLPLVTPFIRPAVLSIQDQTRSSAGVHIHPEHVQDDARYGAKHDRVVIL